MVKLQIRRASGGKERMAYHLRGRRLRHEVRTIPSICAEKTCMYVHTFPKIFLTSRRRNELMLNWRPRDWLGHWEHFHHLTKRHNLAAVNHTQPGVSINMARLAFAMLSYRYTAATRPIFGLPSPLPATSYELLIRLGGGHYFTTARGSGQPRQDLFMCYNITSAFPAACRTVIMWMRDELLYGCRLFLSKLPCIEMKSLPVLPSILH